MRTRRRITTRLRVSRVNPVNSEGVLEPVFPLRHTLSNEVYPFIQEALTTYTFSSSASAASFGLVNFSFNLLDQYTSLANVFDQYKIKMVEVCFRPRTSEVVNGSSAYNSGLFSSVIDYDDSTPLTAVGQAYDYQNCLTGRGIDSQTRVLVPHTNSTANTTTAAINLVAPWLDTSVSGIVHYGVKMAWTQTDQVYTMDISVRYYILFRNVR